MSSKLLHISLGSKNVLSESGYAQIKIGCSLILSNDPWKKQ